MKKIGLLLLIVCGMLACSGGTDSATEDATMSELQLDGRSFGTIGEVGDVDWYHYRAVETNNVLQIKCSGETASPRVEFLATVYEKDSHGNLIRIWGDHAPEDAALPADLTLNIPIDRPKDLYIAVRDLKDDEASAQTRYCLQLAYTKEAVENETFAQATALGVDDPATCNTDTIGEVGDVDCYRFQVSSNGVYFIETQFDFYDTTPVRLAIHIYNELGELVHTMDGVQTTLYQGAIYLEAGQYFISIHDQGRDDADASASYTVCVTSVDVTEMIQNDDSSIVQTMPQDLSAAHPKYDIQAALEYQQDQDWYALPVSAAVGDAFQTIRLTFAETVPAGVQGTYQIMLQDSLGQEILVHDHPIGAHGYTVQTSVEAGDHFVSIRPAPGFNVIQALDYTLTAEVLSVDDAAERVGDGNDGINAADTLTPPTDTVQGKIAFRGDNDWYRVTVPNDTAAQILSLNFQAQDLSAVEYCVDIMNGGQVRSLSDANGLDTATGLKTSYYVPVGADPNYFIKVCDCQGDDGADVVYDLTMSVDLIPSAVAAVPAGLNPQGKATVYNGEPYERALQIGDIDTGEAIEVECAIYPHYDPEFIANNLVLKVAALDSANQYRSDWIAGYIDYQGDQDWFVLDIKPMVYTDSGVSQPAPATWYYDIEIQLYSPGSQVEYTWKLYRDQARNGTPPNGIVIERTPGTTDILNVDDRDGIMAAWAASLVAVLPAPQINKVVPDAVDNGDFWIGDVWQNDRYYLSISDFNYTRVNQTDMNPVPDDDWGYDAPYYFQIRLGFHPNTSAP